ncbi:microtubule-destabilizing protein 60 isoform X1 [Typha angustifolia]|uniref:microtubule-destabilizing protein 60 isoform X1 n=2 Tax=Typha angustifolia TaxID=59011 RepID=UPI003C2D87C9
MATPTKNSRPSRSQTSQILQLSENSDPNIPISPLPSQKLTKSPAVKSAQAKKSATKTPGRANSNPASPPRERKFIVAKRNTKRRGKDFDLNKCRKEAYETLRASQEEFFRKGRAFGDEIAENPKPQEATGSKDEAKKEDLEKDMGVQELEGSSKVRKMRSLVMEKALNSVPETGSGRVKHLVKAFESLLSISSEKASENGENGNKMVLNWPLPGLQPPVIPDGSEVDSVSVFSSAEFFRSGELDMDSRLHSSMDCNGDRFSWGSRTSGGGQRSRRNSSESSRRSWNKMLKVTSQHPFKLRTEQRGRLKEEQFLRKVKEMLVEEEKKRIPIAQGLPWTTDEPEILVKPPLKERTEPIDLLLHSDVRAVERAEFDNYVAERINFAEQLRLERERQQKLEEEEEIKRLRRELVPKAQPMPYFDRPFIPKRSTRPRTVPKEPRFHPREMKSSCSSEAQSAHQQ